MLVHNTDRLHRPRQGTVRVLVGRIANRTASDRSSWNRRTESRSSLHRAVRSASARYTNPLRRRRAASNRSRYHCLSPTKRPQRRNRSIGALHRCLSLPMGRTAARSTPVRRQSTNRDHYRRELNRYRRCQAPSQNRCRRRSCRHTANQRCGRFHCLRKQ
ncbi:hypothetical protein CA13_39300 [Planctomycetes bacterium CA13]|uniref:Uncharacterized protein n=1 Tax=Novipirellula herctigrandis TaxID=2527986 RepID=A0A5C5Z5Y1_9BACT|nr:hypothetical protein CA13_39300 [Planctomycetes bacterium CA13]